MRNPETRKKYLEANKEKIKQQKRENYLANQEKRIKYQTLYNNENKDKINEYRNKKHSTDIMYKLRKNVRNLIGNSIRNNNFKKLSKTEQILGCTFEEFKTYLESKFEPWMTWDNRGNWNGVASEPNTAWDIDHIIPLVTATNETELIKLNHYTNLQPLCSYTNRYIKR